MRKKMFIVYCLYIVLNFLKGDKLGFGLQQNVYGFAIGATEYLYG